MSKSDIMGALWWSRLVNSVRFLDDVQNILMDNRSVELVFEEKVPWREIMLDILEQRLTEKTDKRSFDILDVSCVKSPGEYLMEKYCSQQERNKYWPTDSSPECFLARNQEITLNRRYVCLTGLHCDNAEEWISSIGEYIASCDQSENHGIFILMIEGQTTVSSKHLSLFTYSNYVSDYDCMMLCLTVISSFSCSRAEKMYICEIASNIAENHVERAGLLATEGVNLIKAPEATAESVYSRYSIPCHNMDETITRAVWKAQIKLVFPKLENFRVGLIRKYEKKLYSCLPIRNSNKEIIENPMDLEIGQLFYLCRENRVSRITDFHEYDMLRKMKDARNTLAHQGTLSYEQLKALEIL